MVSIPDEAGAGKLGKAALGPAVRKGLADISNLPQLPRPSVNDKSMPISAKTTEYIKQLQKENVVLVNLLADRNKVILLSVNEQQKLKVDLQNMRQQNLQLAQSNSQMLAELNSARDMLKVVRHELACTKGSLKTKTLELEEKVKARASARIDDKLQLFNKREEVGKSSISDAEGKKFCHINKQRQSKSLSSALKQDQVKEKLEKKRPCVRRRSTMFKSEDLKSSEDLSELKSAKLSVHSLSDGLTDNEGSCTLCLSVSKDCSSASEATEFGRSSIGRPLRQAAKKVQSYKEVPINVKMRRIE